MSVDDHLESTTKITCTPGHHEKAVQLYGLAGGEGWELSEEVQPVMKRIEAGAGRQLDR